MRTYKILLCDCYYECYIESCYKKVKYTSRDFECKCNCYGSHKMLVSFYTKCEIKC